ncbi:DivIVA domain-containing protein [Mycetocola zhadangensis]|uniref:DivIVA domain-containing protein n=1 Tax=Mycetocola zhadangensis TaxID=1164595 RepID=A0A3L7J8V2_9MICO|nr:DivIVA domain-containing protein [Mycetocola zhadangensis]RLQ85881.1 DivIVA domain-containing protein [Mycetocola zhadangensis]GGE86626.1 DivIVA domain-containing protein [Mycetocola zhadangensis]
MSTTFPPTRKRTKGYNVTQVDAFLAQARAAYDADDSGPTGLTASDIRHTSFSLVRGGYSTSHVDAALERLEDAFALRERERAFTERGKGEWLGSARETAQVILNRITRPDGRRFHRTSILAQGYSVADVDALCVSLTDYFERGVPFSTDAVRTAVFGAQRGGYREAQVDLLLDSVIEVMLAVR